MSCDGMFTIRRGGRDDYYYDRWAARRIDAMLLRGPEAFVAWVEQLTPTRAPFVERCICGAVLVDLDRRDVLYWASMGFRGAALERYYRALLAAQWPGFTVREAIDPAGEFAAALAVTIAGIDEARALATLVEVPDDVFTRGWRALLDSFEDRPEDLAGWIAASGVEGVRDAADHGKSAWLTVRAADGTLYDQRGHATQWRGLLRVGPRLVTLAQLGGPRPDFLWSGLERDIDETVFVDEAARTVHWWRDDPAWWSVERFCDALWPGWTLAHDARGTRGHVERSGRSLSALRLPRDQQREQLAEMLTRLLTSQGVAPAMLAREAARLLAGRPAATTRAMPDPPGEGELLPWLAPQLDAWIERFDGF